MIRSSVLASAAMAATFVSIAASAAERLNVKTGLWEVDSTTQMSGTLPISKQLRETLTPAQIAKIQSDMKAEAAKGPTRDKSKSCITEEDLEQPFNPSDADQCTQTFSNGTRTTQEVRMTCAGEYQGTGVLKITTPTPQTMTGSMVLTFGNGADAYTLKSTLQGRWLSADCGDEEEDEADVDEDEEPADDEEEEQ